MMPAPYSANLRWRVIWFVHILQNSVAEASFFLGVCERTVERYISKFLVNGVVKRGPVGRSHGSISLSPREQLIVFVYQIWKPQFLSVVQFLFDNCHSPFSPTAFFEIDVSTFTSVMIMTTTHTATAYTASVTPTTTSNNDNNNNDNSNNKNKNSNNNKKPENNANKNGAER